MQRNKLGCKSVAASTGPSAGALGVAEIQEAALSSPARSTVDRLDFSERSDVICALADGAARFRCGSVLVETLTPGSMSVAP